MKKSNYAKDHLSKDAKLAAGSYLCRFHFFYFLYNTLRFTIDVEQIANLASLASSMELAAQKYGLANLMNLTQVTSCPKWQADETKIIDVFGDDTNPYYINSSTADESDYTDDDLTSSIWALVMDLTLKSGVMDL